MSATCRNDLKEMRVYLPPRVKREANAAAALRSQNQSEFVADCIMKALNLAEAEEASRESQAQSA